jgi:ABC-type microcin C transport system duplicated ATPase subunit YejF
VPPVERAVGAHSGGQRQAIAVARAAWLIIELIERLRARGDIAI